MNYVLSLDCGVSTGIALIGYEEDEAPTLVKSWQFYGGLSALKEWVRLHWSDAWYDSEWGYSFPASLKPSGSVVGGGLSAQNITEWVWDDELNDEVETLTSEKVVTVICEKFTARATKGFSYTTASLEPLRCEGLLIGRHILPDYAPAEKVWRDPGLQYLVGGKDLADKKKRQHAFLKDAGFYRTNKDFPDSRPQDGADDFRSAAAHGLAYLARELKHKPTFELLTGWAGA